MPDTPAADTPAATVARRLLPTLYAVSAVTALAILGPLIRPGYLLYRDAVSTPRTFITDTTLGIDGLAPRAVPQDWLVATLSTVIDGGWVVTAILFAALILAGVGYGRMAGRLLPGTGPAGACVAAIVSVWNPYVAERLLQGHWGLLVGYASLGWIVVALLDVRDAPTRSRWVALAAMVAIAGLTPTGSLLAGAAVVAVGLAPLLRRRTSSPRTILMTAAGGLAIWIVGAAPWLVAATVGGSTTVGGSGLVGVRAFGLRAEPGLGSVGTTLGLGGIWNSDAVPTSRTMWWAAVATLCLLVVVAVGAVELWSRRADLDPAVPALATLAAITVVVVIAAATPPGEHALGFLVDTVGGLGLLRDTQKLLALVIPFVALAAAGACTWAGRWVPTGFAIAATLLLAVAPLPDLAWGVGGRITTIEYPSEWSQVASIVTPDDGAVLLWPPGTVRRYDFADAPSLDPAPRMLRAPVLQSGELTVDGITVDAADAHTAAAQRILSDGGSASELAEVGVGWVLAEGTTTQTPRPTGAEVAFRGDDLVLYRIPGATPPATGTLQRVAAWTANVVWLGVIAAGAVVSIVWPVAGRRRARQTNRRSRRP